MSSSLLHSGDDFDFKDADSSTWHTWSHSLEDDARSADDTNSCDDEFDAVHSAHRNVLRRCARWLRHNRCYCVAVCCLILVAIALGAAPTALNLNEIATYAPKPIFSNTFSIELRVTNNSLNVEDILIQPVASLVDEVEVGNLSVASDFILAELIVKDPVNVTANDLSQRYNDTFSADQVLRINLIASNLEFWIEILHRCLACCLE